MESPLTQFLERASRIWPLEPQRQAFRQQVKQRGQQLQAWISRGYLPTVLLVERDPVDFLAGFVAACTFECPIFLGSPDWGSTEWQQVGALVRPDLIWGKIPATELRNPPRSLASPPKGWIMIPTGGSSGNIRFAIHTWETLIASVQGFQAYFDLQQVNCFCVLPLYHVSGLMQGVRSLHSGGQWLAAPWKAVAAGQWCDVDPSSYFLSLVPTQLQTLLDNPQTQAWLSRFQTVLLGGAPAWPDLLERARLAGIPLAPTYGMTETASQVATLKPEAFLRGQGGCGPALPHASITVQDTSGVVLPAQRIGTVVIRAKSLALGYYPDRWFNGTLKTEDLGFWNFQGSLQIVGRRSQMILTGGEKVLPAEVEAAILATNQVTDVCVIGLPDPYWGQAVIAVYVPKEAGVLAATLKPLLSRQLSRFKHPKHWIAVAALPRNAQGKINREQVQQLARAWCHPRHSTDAATQPSQAVGLDGNGFED
jgi:o-succinylbenzoate---CoA ligase